MKAKKRPGKSAFHEPPMADGQKRKTNFALRFFVANIALCVIRRLTNSCLSPTGKTC